MSLFDNLSVYISEIQIFPKRRYFQYIIRNALIVDALLYLISSSGLTERSVICCLRACILSYRELMYISYDFKSSRYVRTIEDWVDEDRGREKGLAGLLGKVENWVKIEHRGMWDLLWFFWFFGCSFGLMTFLSLSLCVIIIIFTIYDKLWHITTLFDQRLVSASKYFCTIL